MPEFTEEEGKKLLKLARQSIEEELSGKKPEILKELKETKFQQARGVFVTLTNKKDESLRGCIGFPEARIPLEKAVTHSAKSAAFSDPRFPPLRKQELDKIKIEVSILTEPVICKPSEVEIGKHGLICEYVGYSGLLLPQVAVMHKMSREEFIESLCRKANLPPESWKKQGFKLFKFQAQIFSEE